MPIADVEVEALRLDLKGRTDESRRLVAGFKDSGHGPGFSALGFAAYYEAVDKKFGSNSKPSDVIDFVAGMRRVSGQTEEIDAEKMERIVMYTLDMVDDDAIDGIDGFTLDLYRYFALTAITVEARYSDAELEEFLTLARATGEEVLRLRAEAT